MSAARLRPRVQRRLRRRVVGADVAVAVVLVGVGQQHAGLRSRGRRGRTRPGRGRRSPSGRASPAGRRARRASSGRRRRTASRACTSPPSAGPSPAAAVVQRRVVRVLEVRRVDDLVVGLDLHVVDEPARPREPRVGRVGEAQRRARLADQVGDVVLVVDEARRPVVAREPVDGLRAGRVGRAGAGDARCRTWSGRRCRWGSATRASCSPWPTRRTCRSCRRSVESTKP